MSRVVELLTEIVKHKDMKDITNWLRSFLQRTQDAPELYPPISYPSPGTFLIEILYEYRQHELSMAFGEAAGFLFHESIADGSFRRALISKDKSLLSDILLLVEALPCSASRAKELLEALFILIATGSDYRAQSGEEVNLYRRLIRAVASKIKVARYDNPALAYLFAKDLYDRDYAAAAYAIILRLNSTYADEHLRDVLETLQKGNLPTTYVMFDIAKLLSESLDDRSAFLRAIAELPDNRVRAEFISHLEYLKSNEILDAFKKIESSSALVKPTDLNKFYLTLSLIVKEKFLEEPVNPKVVGKIVGEILSHQFYSQYLTKFGGDAFPVEIIGNGIIWGLDNGGWEYSSAAKSTSKWFNLKHRRLIGACAARNITFIFSQKWALPYQTLQDSLTKYSPEILQKADDVAQLYNGSKKPLIMGTSPFFEDQMYYFVLNLVGSRSQLKISNINVPWGSTLSVEGSPADFVMVNELTSLARQRKNTLNDDEIYRHRGYYIFASRSGLAEIGIDEVPNNTRDRFDAAFRLGLSNFTGGEYRTMIKCIAENFNLYIEERTSRTTKAITWALDFEKFVTGETNLYVGGSVNAHLLIRLWMPYTNGRIVLLCNPNDFSAALKNTSGFSNRLIFGSPSLKNAKEQKNFHAIADLLRACGEYLDVCAQRAIGGDSDAVKVIRHLMHIIAPHPNDQEEKQWTWVAAEEDGISLLTIENNLVISREAHG